jgi:hypothetical protein
LSLTLFYIGNAVMGGATFRSRGPHRPSCDMDKIFYILSNSNLVFEFSISRIRFLSFAKFQTRHSVTLLSKLTICHLTRHASMSASVMSSIKKKQKTKKKQIKDPTLNA